MSTWIKRGKQTARSDLPGCHGGNGTLDWAEVVSEGELPGRRLSSFHDDVLPPGASIGVHQHEDDEEYYYILSGTGIMTLDGVDHTVEPGDLTAVFPGGSHGLRNTGAANLRVLVVSIR